MIVEQFMTQAPLRIQPEAPLEAALQIMDEYGVRHLPVVEGDRVVGVVSNRDLLGLTDWRAASSKDGKGRRRKEVREVMQADVVTVSPGDQVVAAAVELSVRGIGCLPVLDGGKLVGITTEMDLIRLVAEAHRSLGVEPVLVNTIASSDAFTVTPAATHEQVDLLMNSKRIRHVPVVEGDRLLGMVSDRDMRRAAGQGLVNGTPVRDFMTEGVLTVAGDLGLADAADVMTNRRVGALVVTAESGSLGIVTSTDILEHAIGAL